MEGAQLTISFACPKCKQEFKTDKLGLEVLLFNKEAPDVQCSQCENTFNPSEQEDFRELRQKFPKILFKVFVTSLVEMEKQGILDQFLDEELGK